MKSIPKPPSWEVTLAKMRQQLDLLSGVEHSAMTKKIEALQKAIAFSDSLRLKNTEGTDRVFTVKLQPH